MLLFRPSLPPTPTMAMNGVPMEFADDVCSMKNPKSLTEVSKIEAADVWSASSQYVKERQQVIQVHFYVDEHGKISYKIGGCSKAVLSLKSIVVKHVYFIYLGELEHPEDATSVTESNWKILKFLGGAGKSLTLAGFMN
ncbi:hypothetical protein L596_001546 [Steinernema carpocapsae]|uniref:Uncharacterized protein n=1 Tax=Steinernema carpocapsae TaxID=34508 RepID=A0A4U8UNK1_STECR|nr:hypothetical protein L596_001546 [Steinernema carpocapsae]